MGCDIHGYIEYRMRNTNMWFSVARLGSLMDRDYDLFGFLFGVRNYSSFKPIAANRGIPEDPSSTVKDELEKWGDDAHSQTWISYKELKAIDWNQKSGKPDNRIHQLKKVNSEDGFFWEYVGKASAFGDNTIISILTIGDAGFYVKDDSLYYIGSETAEKLKTKSLETCLSITECIAKQYGEDNVRWVVWFDN